MVALNAERTAPVATGSGPSKSEHSTALSNFDTANPLSAQSKKTAPRNPAGVRVDDLACVNDRMLLRTAMSEAALLAGNFAFAMALAGERGADRSALLHAEQARIALREAGKIARRLSELSEGG
jgi:hypothetical protein